MAKLIFERCRTQTGGVLALSKAYPLIDGNLRGPPTCGGRITILRTNSRDFQVLSYPLIWLR